MNQPKWKIIIVGESQDDCQLLKNLLLKSSASVEIIKEVCSLEESISTLQLWHKSCNLMFLRVNLSDGNIFDVLDQIEDLQTPLVFLSDDIGMRPRATKYNALHYIIPPFSTGIFKPIFQELGRTFNSRNSKKTLYSAPALIDNSIHIKTNGTKHIVHLEDILYVFGEGNYATLHLHSGVKMLISKPLIQFERLLPTYQFHRIHQSYLVNRYKIVNVKYGTESGLTLENGDQCPISRRRKHGFILWLSHLATSHISPLPPPEPPRL